jgi:hypothetical protein
MLPTELDATPKLRFMYCAEVGVATDAVPHWALKASVLEKTIQ